MQWNEENKQMEEVFYVLGFFCGGWGREAEIEKVKRMENKQRREGKGNYH